MGVLNFITRRFVGDDTTARLSYQQYNGLPLTSYRGWTGFNVLGQITATYSAGIAPGPTHKLNDPTATGNNSYNLNLQPLTDNRSI